MKLKLQSFAVCVLFLVAGMSWAQQITNDQGESIYVGQAKSMRVVPSIASRATLTPAEPLTKEPQDGRSIRKSKVDVVPGKDRQTEDDYYTRNPGRLDKKIKLRNLENDFVVNNNVGSPSDPALGVGPNHTFVVYNTGLIIYDKDGVDLTGPFNVNNIFSGGGCCDLTVSYDNAADRWVLTYLFVGAGMELAVSDGPDPTTANWFVYLLPQVNDYNKLSVWRDGYYITDNGSRDVWVIDRAAALAGDPTANIQGFTIAGVQGQNFTSAQVLNITDANHPTTGGAPLVYMRDDAFAGVTDDEVRIWTVNVDFATPANSNVSAPEIFPVTDFINVFDGGSFSNLTQPGGSDIDALQSTIMNQAQFRKFPSYNSAIFNFVVDTDASAGELAGIRWYEFRQTGDGQPWTMFQEGTFNAPDGKHAWNGSMAMDSQGNIGLGYSSMAGPTTPNPTANRVGAFYTGRFASDAPGVMSLAETIIGSGGNVTGTTRFGDYAKMDVDPSDGKTFWFITEYAFTNHVGVFRIAPDTTNDVGVVSVDTPVSGPLTNSESVTVTVFNFGESAASGFNVNFQVDGGSTISEAFPGTLASNTSAQYTFTSATADLSTAGQTYAITSCTTLGGDEDINNDCVVMNVTNVAASDVGVIEITAPVSGEGLTNETVTITIENFGSADQSGFNVNYSVDGGTPVVETVAATIVAGGTGTFSFAAPANLSTVGTYVITSSTLLAGDFDASNDTATTTVSNVSCLSTLSADTPIAISPSGANTISSVIEYTEDFLLDDVNVTINIEHTYASDLTIFLTAPDGTTTVNLSSGNGGSANDYTNTVFDDEAANPITGGSAPFTGTFQPEGSLADFDGLQSIGNWTLTVADGFNLDGGALLDWTLQLCGNTNLSVNDFLTEDGIVILHEGNDQYLVKLPTTTITDRLEMTVLNSLGQILSYKTLENDSGQGYENRLDMSHVASGVYFVRIGNNRASNIRRIIVN